MLEDFFRICFTYIHSLRNLFVLFRIGKEIYFIANYGYYLG